MNIDELYSGGKYDLVYNEFLNNEELENNEHYIKLFLRSSNRIGRNVWERFKDNIKITGDIDYLWNKIQFSDNTNVKKSTYELFKKIIKENREDLIEDFMIFYYDKFNNYPQYTDYILYIIENINKPIIKKYLDMLEEPNIFYELLIILLNKKNTNSILKKITNISTIGEIAFNTFLYNKELNKENFELFINSFNYKKEKFVIYEGDIFIIEMYDEIKKQFILKDKMGKNKNVDFKDLISTTKPIEKGDFRVYKYFKPEDALNIAPCELLKLILKYRQTAIDRDELKKELIYIMGKDAQKWIMKNKKNFENCDGVEIFYGKKERYMFVNENTAGILNHIKRIKKIEKIRDYIMEVIAKREITDAEKREIINYVSTFKNEIVNEVFFIIDNRVNKDEMLKYENIDIFKYKLFIKYILKTRIQNKVLNNDLFKALNKLNESDIEVLYKLKNEEFNKYLIEKAEKELRLGKEINILKWYLLYHIKDNLINFDLKFIVIRILQIANEIFMSTKSDSFVIFIRKFLFTGKSGKFYDIMNTMEKEKFREIFNVFVNIKFINDYQKDEIRKVVYDKYEDFRVFEKIEYDYSTKESIIKKKEELNDIIQNQLPELSKIINIAAELGDLSENAEYKYAREKYKFLSVKAETLKKELEKSSPIEFDKIDGKIVNYGTIITIEKNNEIHTYTILGPFDVNTEKNIISYKSPLIKKLIGKKEGNTVEEIKIIKIKKI